MNTRSIGVMVFAVAVLAGWCARNRSLARRDAEPPRVTAPAAVAEPTGIPAPGGIPAAPASPFNAVPPLEPRPTGISFRTPAKFEEHFDKHGREFGDITPVGYLRRAKALRDAPVGGDILELKRADGTFARFDRATGAFLAFDPDGTVLTFFRPNDGEAYFRRQARRRGSS